MRESAKSSRRLSTTARQHVTTGSRITAGRHLQLGPVRWLPSKIVDPAGHARRKAVHPVRPLRHDQQRGVVVRLLALVINQQTIVEDRIKFADDKQGSREAGKVREQR